MGSKSTTFAVLAAALCLALPLASHSAGLGKLTVLSPLGRPLNAEIELVSQPGEQDLVARLASPEAFSRAGIELSPALLGMRFNIERRNGRQVLRVTTTQPVNEPFLDLLVDLQWNSGRLFREYTVLLDPPEYRSRQAIAAAPPPAPAAVPPKPQAKPESPSVRAKPKAPPVEAQPLAPEPSPAAPTSAPAAAEAPAAAPAAAAAAPEQPPAEPAAASDGTHEVKKGETLGGIARKNLPPGVTLSQMLVALYRANEDAFIRGNVNLVRAGKILNIPDAESIGTVDPEDANRLVKAHQAQFSEYRSRLAAVPAPAEAAAGERDAAGRIEPKPQAVAPAGPADQVRLSKADPNQPSAPGARAASEDDRVARERELREAQSRVADLEKNVSDLQKLLEMKNQQLAELEKKAGAQAAAPSAAPLAPPAAKVPEKPAAKAPERPAAAKAPEQSVAAQAPEKPPAPEAAKPPPAAKAPDKSSPAAAKPKPRPAPPPPPERGVLDDYLEDPAFVGGLGLVVLLLLGYGVWSWRRKKAVQSQFHDSVLGAAAAGAAAGAADEQGAHTVQPAVSQASASQAPAGMEAEEVDPIAEADVYIAYGRDAQAEEILNEALQKDASRTAVHAKLLEIYANRKDAKSFEQTALKLKNVTNGTGPEWEKATALGRSIDPRNGLYGATAAAAAAVAAAPAAAAAPVLDFDLGGSSQNQASGPDISLDDSPAEQSSGVDIDLGVTGPATGGTDTEQEHTVGSIDFNLELGSDKAAPVPPPAPAAHDAGGLDFDLKLDDLPAAPPTQDQPPAAVDLGSISLDLGMADATAGAAPDSADPKWQEAATKLDLAKAYEEMGDKDGARELLNEVMKDGDAAQKGQAQQLLAKLA